VRRGPEPSPLERMSRDCEPVHNCSAEGLLNLAALGISGAQLTGAAGTRFFEPDGVAFLRIGLPVFIRGVLCTRVALAIGGSPSGWG
jgi:hypothetical protein